MYDCLYAHLHEHHVTYFSNLYPYISPVNFNKDYRIVSFSFSAVL
jgi:hypothetical protein